MCSAVVKFLSLTIIVCTAIIDGALCHEQWEREPNGSNTTTASDTTGTGGLSTGGKIGVSVGVPGGLVTFILSTLGGLTCCRKKRKRNASNTTESGGANNQESTQEKRWSLKNVCNRWFKDCKNYCNCCNHSNKHSPNEGSPLLDVTSDTTGTGGLTTGVSNGVPGGLVAFILSALACCLKKQNENSSNEKVIGGADIGGDTQGNRNWSVKNGAATTNQEEGKDVTINVDNRARGVQGLPRQKESATAATEECSCKRMEANAAEISKQSELNEELFKLQQRVRETELGDAECHKQQQLPLQLKWRKCRDMEYGMSHYPCSVVLEKNLYVGGGEAVDRNDSYTVLVYNIEADNWSRLPKYQYKWFAVTVIKNCLTLVGGCDPSNKPTNQLAVFNAMSQEWTSPYPPMPTPRDSPAVVMYDIWLLVAGGCGGAHELATVELFNTSTKQWLSSSPLPMPCGWMTSTILKDSCYFVTDSKQVLCVSLPDIVSQTISQSTTIKSPALWYLLPGSPLTCSAAITLHGSLLTVGGRYDNDTSSTAIYLYQPESKEWTKVGELPNARRYCSCVLIPSGEMLVAGGYDSSKQITSQVDVASAQN